jgi:hypothetical protein
MFGLALIICREKIILWRFFAFGSTVKNRYLTNIYGAEKERIIYEKTIC